MRKHDTNWPGIILAIIAGLAVGFVVVLLGMQLVNSENERKELRSQIADLTTQNRGPQGPEGDPGRAPTEEEIAAAVADYCAANGGCIGPKGDTGAPGKNGVNGAAGPAGANGANGGGVTSVRCFGTYIRFYSGATPIGDIKMVCIP